jgi:hypothetical protein
LVLVIFVSLSLLKENLRELRENLKHKILSKGVPDSVRGQLWAILLSVGQLREEQPKVYEKMKHIARLHSPDIRQVRQK